MTCRLGDTLRDPNTGSLAVCRKILSEHNVLVVIAIARSYHKQDDNLVWPHGWKI